MSFEVLFVFTVVSTERTQEPRCVLVLKLSVINCPVMLVSALYVVTQCACGDEPLTTRVTLSPLVSGSDRACNDMHFFDVLVQKAFILENHPTCYTCVARIIFVW